MINEKITKIDELTYDFIKELSYATKNFDKKERTIVLSCLLYWAKRGCVTFAGYEDKQGLYIDNETEDETDITTNQFFDKIVKDKSAFVNELISTDFSRTLKKVTEYSGNENIYVHILDNYINSYRPLSDFYFQSNLLDTVTYYLLDNKCKSVLDPFGGLLYEADHLPEGISMEGFEIDETTWFTGIIRLFLMGLSDRVELKRQDAKEWTQKKFDAIITYPPITEIDMFGSTLPAYETVIRQFESTTTENGMLVLVIPSGRLRLLGSAEYIVSNNLVDTVVSFPAYRERSTFFSTVGLSILFLKKGRKEQKVRLVDFTSIDYEDLKGQWQDLLESEDTQYVKWVSREDIKQNRNKLLPTLYERITVENIPNNYERKDISSLLSRVAGKKYIDIPIPPVTHRQSQNLGFTTGFMIQSHDYSPASSSFPKKVILTKNLSENPFIKVEPSSSDIIEKSQREFFYIISRPVFLVYRGIKGFTTGYCNATSANPVAVDFRIKTYTISNDIDPDYLRLQISKLNKNFNRLWDYDNLHNATIGFPDIQEQRRAYKEAKNIFGITTLQNNGLGDDYIKELLDSQTSTVRHTMRQCLSAFKDNCDHINKKIAKGQIDIKDLSETVRDMLLSVTDMRQLINSFGRGEDYGDPEIVDIIELCKLKGQTYANKDKFTLTLEEDHESLDDFFTNNGCVNKVLVKISPVAFNVLFQNIVTNAEVHGFTDPHSTKESNQINVVISVEAEEKRVRIDFTNNGEKMPDDIDKNTYGLFKPSGETGGQGIGGYDVKRITKLAGGDYDIKSDDLQTTITIWLPIYFE